MAIEEVIDRAVQLRQTIEIEYCTRSGRVFTCRISDIIYSRYYGGQYILAYRLDIKEERTFKISRILKVNGHSFSRIFWNQIGDNFNRIWNNRLNFLRKPCEDLGKWKKFANFAKNLVKSGCTLAKSEFSAFGLHWLCPQNMVLAETFVWEQ